MADVAPAAQGGSVQQNVEVATSVPAESAPVVPPSGGASVASSAGQGIIGGLQQAHSDFCAWFYQPHGASIDAQLAGLDNGGIKREFVGYGLAGLVLLLLFTSAAPLVANLACIAYPMVASLAVLRGQSSDSHRLLVYWLIFGVLSIFDYYFGRLFLYWIVKVAACTVLYLPQTQGAGLVYSLVIEPLANAVSRQA